MELDLRLGAAFTRMQTFGLKQVRELDQKLISYGESSFTGENICDLLSFVLIFCLSLLFRSFSAGPCQFPTLGFVVDQYERVKNFVSEPFWYIAVSHDRDLPAAGNGAANAIALDSDEEDAGNGNQNLQGERISVQFKWKRNHLFDFRTAVVLFEGCLESPEAEITNVNSRPTKKW